MGPISPLGFHCPLCYMKFWLLVSNTGLIVIFTDVLRVCIIVRRAYVHIAINLLFDLFDLKEAPVFKMDSAFPEILASKNQRETSTDTPHISNTFYKLTFRY